MPESQGSNATPETKIISENRREKKRKRDVIDRKVSKVFSENRKKKFRVFYYRGRCLCEEKQGGTCPVCCGVW